MVGEISTHPTHGQVSNEHYTIPNKIVNTFFLYVLYNSNNCSVNQFVISS